MTANRLFLAFIWVAIGLASPLQAQTPYEKLKERFEDGAVFEAQFVHSYADSYTQDTVQNSGHIWVGNQQYKVEGTNQRVAVDGQLSRVYDPQRNRLIVSQYVPEEDDFAPSRILNGIDSTYAVTQQEQQGRNYKITLQSDDPFALFREVQITLNGQNIPTMIYVLDPSDNEITTEFTDGRFIERAPSLFELSYPDSAEVIDMRN